MHGAVRVSPVPMFLVGFQHPLSVVPLPLFLVAPPCIGAPAIRRPCVGGQTAGSCRDSGRPPSCPVRRDTGGRGDAVPFRPGQWCPAWWGSRERPRTDVNRFRLLRRHENDRLGLVRLRWRRLSRLVERVDALIRWARRMVTPLSQPETSAWSRHGRLGFRGRQRRLALHPCGSSLRRWPRRAISPDPVEPGVGAQHLWDQHRPVLLLEVL